MKLRITSLFTEPGYSFNVSFKVRKLMEKLLNDSIMSDLSLGNKNTFLSFHITTRKDADVAEAKGPDQNEKVDCITWALFLPFKKINDAEDYELTYCAYFFEAALQVFNYYMIENAETKIQILKEEITKEIIANSIYRERYKKTEILDLSDMGL